MLAMKLMVCSIRVLCITEMAAVRGTDLALCQRYSGMQEVCLSGPARPPDAFNLAMLDPDSIPILSPLSVRHTCTFLPSHPPSGHSAPGDRKKTDEEHEHTIPGAYL